MDDAEITAARLASLEASNRRLRLVACAALVLAVLGPVWLFERFKAKFYSANLYTPSLVLIDPKGGIAALQLVDDRRGSQLALSQIGTNANVSLRANPDGGRSLVFVDGKARKRAFFGIDDTGRPRLVFFDENGLKTWEARSEK